MNDSTLTILIQRVERLEQVNRWWKLLGISAVVMLGLAVLLGVTGGKEAQIVDELRAKQFIVVDQVGSPVAILGGIPPDLVGLGLFDKKGKIRLRLQVDSHSIASLALLHDTDEVSGISLAAGAEGMSVFTITDKKNLGRVMLGMAEDQGPIVFAFQDIHGKRRMILNSEADGSSQLGFFDRNGKVTWVAP